MKKLLLSIIAAASLAVVTISPAVAGGNFYKDRGDSASEVSYVKWKGCHLSGGATHSSGVTELTLSDGTDSASFDGLGASGAGLTVSAGCDTRLSKRVVAGVFGSFTHYGNNESTLSFPGASFSVGIENEYNVGARIGYLPLESVFLYAHAGWSWADTVNNFGWTEQDDLNGVSVGGGVEVALGKTGRWTVNTKYTATFYGDNSYDVGGGLTLNEDTTTHKIGSSLVYNF